MLADSDLATETAMAAYGRHLGTAFQLVDDALDYSADSDELGKNVGDDLAEGKPTLPLIYAMQQSNTKQSNLIREAIKQGGLEYIDEITAIIEKTGALDYTFNQAKAEAKKAKSSIEFLPQGEYRQALMFLADYAVERRF